MFGKKVSDVTVKRPVERRVNHEQTMLEYAQRMKDHRRKASAVVVHLSRAAGFGYDNYLYAINMFKALVTRFQGSLFILSNHDLVFAYHGPPGEPAVKDAIFKVRLLFDVPNVEVENGEDFATWFDLELNHDDFIRFAEHRLADKQVAAAAQPRAAWTATREPEPIEGAGSERPSLDALGKFMGVFEVSDLSSLLRRQPICRITPDHPPHILLHEIYVSIADLERKLMPSMRLMSDRYLFQYVTHALDKRVLKMIKQQMEVLPAASFSLNMNVATVISPEFEAFDAALTPELRKSIVLELPRVDVMADLSMFLAVRDRAKERGYRLCFDGLSALIMPYIRLQDLGFDLFKIGWSRDLVEMRDSDQRTLLQGVVDRCDARRMILCHCDSEEAIRFGSGLGITMYQGRYVDEVLAARK